MKVLLINGSPHKEGCTYTALSEVAAQLQKHEIETEIFWIGNEPVGGCIGCHETRSFSATMGTGQLVYGLAAVIIGVSIIHFYTGTRLARGLRKSGPLRFLGSPQGTTAVVLGSVLYKLCIQVAMSLGLPTNMMKLITAALFLLVLVLSGRKGEAIIHA